MSHSATSTLLLMAVVAGAVLLSTTTTSTAQPSPRHLRPISPGDLQDYKKLAEWAVEVNNKNNPKSEPLTLVSLDTGYSQPTMDFTYFEFYLTANSTHSAPATYFTTVLQGNGYENQVENFYKYTGGR
ncbi:unnamed protein product [Linum trigynum]|uniref:Cysteine proteinase inhibitor n=1 Tax=Linum trigynum TaxID=586398 RepID=A0AAV2C733_9ROSI